VWNVMNDLKTETKEPQLMNIELESGAK